MYFFLFILDFIVLYLLSRYLIGTISSLFHRTSGSIHFTIYALFLLLFPGTLIHELAHLLAAHLLGVPSFNVELFPKLHNQTLRLGSVSIAKTDFIRRTLIGLAPLLVGSGLLFLCIWTIQSLQNPSLLLIIFLGFLLFEISNTMFPSRKDMEGSWKFFLILVCFTTFLVWIIGGMNILDVLFESVSIRIGSTYLSFVILIDFVFLLILRVLSYTQTRLYR